MKIETIKALHSYTHSIQLWGSNWDDTLRCQDYERSPAEDSDYAIMPVELADGKTSLEKEAYRAVCLQQGSMDKYTVLEFQDLPSSHREKVISITQEILDGDWTPSKMESDAALYAMGYTPYLARLACSLVC